MLSAADKGKKPKGKKPKGEAKGESKAKAEKSPKGGAPAEKKEEKKSSAARVAKGEVPEYMQHRMKIWDSIQARQAGEAKASGESPVSVHEPRRRTSAFALFSGKPITIVLPNGAKVEGKAGITLPVQVAKDFDANVAKKALVARVRCCAVLCVGWFDVGWCSS
jgi:hypothetical protein